MSFLYSVLSSWNKKRDEDVTNKIDSHNVNFIKVNDDGSVILNSSENPKKVKKYIPTYSSFNISCKGNSIEKTPYGYYFEITLLNKDTLLPFGRYQYDDNITTVIMYNKEDEIPCVYKDGQISLVDDYEFPLKLTGKLLTT
jgi:hypothetical protein